MKHEFSSRIYQWGGVEKRRRKIFKMRFDLQHQRLAFRTFTRAWLWHRFVGRLWYGTWRPAPTRLIHIRFTASCNCGSRDTMWDGQKPTHSECCSLSSFWSVTNSDRGQIYPPDLLSIFPADAVTRSQNQYNNLLITCKLLAKITPKNTLNLEFYLNLKKGFFSSFFLE